MNHAMRTRTVHCPHGFQVPSLPEPWTVPRNVCIDCGKKRNNHTTKHEFRSGEEIKASRFCLQCWEKHGQIFIAHGFTHILTEDSCQFGFLDLIQFVLRDHAWYRDQDRYEFLETELRMHLLEQRALIEEAIRERPDTATAYVRRALLNRLQDLQSDDATEFQVQINSVQQEVLDLDRAFADGEIAEPPTLDTADESQLSEQIVEATGQFNSSVRNDDGESLKARSHKAARNISAKRLVETVEQAIDAQDPLKALTKRPRERKLSRKKENAELVRAAIQEQSHRLDALTDLSQKEQDREISRAHRQLFSAVDSLPHDEQMVIRMRFLDGQELRDGRPRPRRDILRELRVTGNGASGWSEWDLRKFEQQAVIRLRQKVKLPSVFSVRD